MNSFQVMVKRHGHGPVAAKLGCSSGLISHWVTGRKRITTDWAIRIEQEFGDEVRVEDIRPDVPWHVIRARPSIEGQGLPQCPADQAPPAPAQRAA